jgi:hypothetical protein
MFADRFMTSDSLLSRPGSDWAFYLVGGYLDVRWHTENVAQDVQLEQIKVLVDRILHVRQREIEFLEVIQCSN